MYVYILYIFSHICRKYIYIYCFLVYILLFCMEQYPNRFIYINLKAYIYCFTYIYVYIVLLKKVSRGLSPLRGPVGAGAGITVCPSAAAMAGATLASPQPPGFLLRAGARVSGPEAG